MNLLSNPVAVVFLSFILGMIGNSVLRRMAVHDSLKDRYLFSGAKTYERLGVLWYRKFLLATPLRFFNTNIRFTTNRTLETLESVKMHMTDAELSHWVAFFAMLVVNGFVLWYRSPKMALAFLLVNIIGNLYPCLLQQYNRHRLAKVINATKGRTKVVAC